MALVEQQGIIDDLLDPPMKIILGISVQEGKHHSQFPSVGPCILCSLISVKIITDVDSFSR